MKISNNSFIINNKIRRFLSIKTHRIYSMMKTINSNMKILISRLIARYKIKRTARFKIHGNLNKSISK